MTDRWVDELARVVTATLDGTPGILLDMSDVTFVDLRGVALLRSLQRRGVDVIACSAFVATLLSGGSDGSVK